MIIMINCKKKVIHICFIYLVFKNILVLERFLKVLKINICWGIKIKLLVFIFRRVAFKNFITIKIQKLEF